MYYIKANQENNYLFIQAIDSNEDINFKDIVSILHYETQKLSQGFTIINDISSLDVLNQYEAERVKEIQAWLFQMGAVKTIRVVGSIFSQAQFKKAQLLSNVKYDTVEVKNINEAMAHIKKSR